MRASIIATSLTVLIGCASVQAQKAKAPSAAESARATMVQSLNRGKLIKVRGETYQLLTDVAVVEGAGAAPAQLDARDTTLVESKGRYRFYRQRAQHSDAVVASSASGPIYPAVLNTRTSQLGIVTGHIAVKLKNITDASRLGAAEGVALDSSFPGIGLVIYRVLPGRDVFDVAERLSANARVLEASAEILVDVQQAE